jgi:hypothetical protein
MAAKMPSFAPLSSSVSARLRIFSAVRWNGAGAGEKVPVGCGGQPEGHLGRHPHAYPFKEIGEVTLVDRPV